MARRDQYLLFVLVAAFAILSGWVVAGTDAWRLHDGIAIAAAAGGLALGSVVAPPASGRNRLSVGIAVAAAIPFVFRVGSVGAVAVVVAVYMLGSVLIAGIEFVRTGDLRPSLAFASRQFVGYSVFATVFAGLRGLVEGLLGSSGWEVLISFVVSGTAWIGVEIWLWSMSSSEEAGVSGRYVALAGVRDLNVFVSLVATGGLFGLMFDALAWWALPVALLPYSFAHGAFRRFQETKSTYRQTIRALAQIPEAAGLNLRGHSDRTAELAVAMAKDLGLTPEEVEDVEFAALMHDIGHITLNDPTVVEQGWSDDDLARWGAEIIAGAPSLDRVSGYVRRQYEPFRKPGEDSDPSVPRVARIVKIASAYDSYRSGEGMSRLEALEELHRGAAYEYDPEVVASLRRVLEGSNRAVNA